MRIQAGNPGTPASQALALKIVMVAFVQAVIIMGVVLFFIAREHPPASPTPPIALVVALAGFCMSIAGVGLARRARVSRGWVWNGGILAPSGERLDPSQIDTAMSYLARARVSYLIGMAMSESPAIFGLLVGIAFHAHNVGYALVGLGLATTMISGVNSFAIFNTTVALEKLEQLARTAQVR